ncbi:DnaJ domain-containing protein [Natrialbaceae archaeon A-CW2]|uniref:DnaJ domain-containing protein n=1 Tax=Natronosalvus amylolyticus TaxID=2961994 RepID=UPI0020C96192|nr:DnaJ domain-containing protein [Natronosalvus amylolyticus]
MDEAETTLYTFLGIHPSASQAVILEAYREKAGTYHPDTPTGSTAMMIRLNKAKAVLTDPAERTRYDRLGHRSYIAQTKLEGWWDDPASQQRQANRTRDRNTTTSSNPGSGDDSGQSRSSDNTQSTGNTETNTDWTAGSSRSTNSNTTSSTTGRATQTAHVDGGFVNRFWDETLISIAVSLIMWLGTTIAHVGIYAASASQTARTQVTDRKLLEILDRINRLGPNLSFAVPRVLIAVMLIVAITELLVSPAALTPVTSALLLVACGAISLGKEFALSVARLSSGAPRKPSDPADPVWVMNIGLLGLIGVVLFVTGSVHGSTDAMANVVFGMLTVPLSFVLVLGLTGLVITGLLSFLTDWSWEAIGMGVFGLFGLWIGARFLFAAESAIFQHVGVTADDLWMSYFTVGPLQAGRILNVFLGAVMTITLLTAFLFTYFWFTTIVRRGFFEQEYPTRPLLWEVASVGPVLTLVWTAMNGDQTRFGIPFEEVATLLVLVVLFVWPALLLTIYGAWVRYRYVPGVGIIR